MRLLILLPMAVMAACPAGAADLALRRIMLSSAGIGYFEYEAAVDGAATLGLDVKLDQVDDVLKSLIVLDAQGSAGAVTLPGMADGRTAFDRLPFGREALQSPLAFLNSLQGIEVSVDGPRPMRGRLLRAETSPPLPPRGPAPAEPARTRVTLLTEAGLKQFVLEDSDAVQVVDPALRERIAAALAATTRDAAQDMRHLTLASRGDGTRTVRAAYVAAAPLWKASYRLVLPPADADPATAKARLQGWATLENATGADWSGIGLALQYGNPVTFRQAIYRSYYVRRPEVPVEVLGRLLPDVDGRANLLMPAPSVASPSPPPPPSPVSMLEPRRAAGSFAQAQMADMIPAQTGADAVAQEAATETVFTLANPVDLPAGHSATVPILDQALPAVAVALAKPGQEHPLAAIRLANDTGSSLPAGVLTLYDPAADAPYAGDARLGGLPAGESRLVAYAQDLRTSIAWRTEDSVAVASLSAASGVLQVDQRNRTITHAAISAPAGAPRRVLIDVAKPAGGTIGPGFAQPQEETATAWRFAADVPAGATVTLAYAVDQHERQSIAVLEDEDATTTLMNMQGVSPAVRDRLRAIAGLRAEEAARTAERDRLKAQKTALDADEARLRANLGALQPNDALRTRLLRQLDADETRHAQLDTSLDAAEVAIGRAHQTLVDSIGMLKP